MFLSKTPCIISENAIIGFSNLSCEDIEISPKEKTEYRPIIATNNQLLLQLINDTLDISKIETGVMAFTEDIIELNSFCNEMEAVYMLRAKNKLEIKFITDHSGEYTLNIDRTRLKFREPD